MIPSTKEEVGHKATIEYSHASPSKTRLRDPESPPDLRIRRTERVGRATGGRGGLRDGSRAVPPRSGELKRDGYLDEPDGALYVALEAGTAEEYTTDGVEYVIRPARQEDLSGILGTIRQITEEKTYLEAESVAEQLDYEGVLIRHNDVETRIFFVATVTDDVVGWAHLEAPELEKLSHAAKLTIGVLEDYLRHGIGSHLLHRGLEWAATQGYRKVYNSIPATNQEAARFLEEHGFETEAIRKEHYMIDDESVDELMMAKTL